MTKPCILIDGSSFLFRAYYAMPNLTNRDGFPTSAIFGTTNMIMKLLADYDPSHIAVVFDAKGKTFRHDLYPDYKANRPPAPDDLIEQIAPLHQLVQSLGLPLIVVPNVEADDVIGTLAAQATAKNIKTLIATSDKDMAQLVNEHVHLLDTQKNHITDAQGVMDKFGVEPSQIIDYLALMGDSSDNIPGVSGVGPKTAAKWLQTYGDVENLVSNQNNIKGKIGEKLRAHSDQIPLSKTLATIKLDCNLPISIEQCQPTEADLPQLIEQLERYELNKWLRMAKAGELPVRLAHDKTSVDDEEDGAHVSRETHYQCVQTVEQWQTMFECLKQQSIFALDTETNALNPYHAQLVGISLCWQSHHAYYVPLNHASDLLNPVTQLPQDRVIADLVPLLQNPNQTVIFQNAKFDLQILHCAANVAMDSIIANIEDTMLLSYSIAPHRKHNMDELAHTHLGLTATSYKTISQNGKLTFDQVPLDQATHYAAEDADITWQLFHVLNEAINPTQQQAYQQLEKPLIPVLATMELNGICLDKHALKQQSIQLTAAIETEKQHIETLAGKAFNINSTKQLQSVLYDDLDLPVLKKTAKGQPSTAEDVLVRLAKEGHAIVQHLLDYRHQFKLQTTYVDKLPKLINSKTGRLHTSYHQTVTSTGRLSSSDPNLQNIPIKTELGKQIRKAFVASDGHQLYAADYSQVELRIMAHLCGDENLIQAFQQGLDIHTMTAAEIFHTDLDQVTVIQRRNAKAVNFGLIYGMSAFGLAQQLDIERKEAQGYIDTYFARYPKVLDFMESAKQQARDHGFVETITGRAMPIANIHSKNHLQRSHAERTAINAPMQGSAADIIKLAMIQLHDWIQTQSNIRLLLQVHDELVFEMIDDDNLHDRSQHIKHIMENGIVLSTPLVVEGKLAKDWFHAH